MMTSPWGIWGWGARRRPLPLIATEGDDYVNRYNTRWIARDSPTRGQ